jgi:hypothetical protein
MIALASGSRSDREARKRMKPICVPCQRFFRPKRNGIYFIEGMLKGGLEREVIRGKHGADDWRPYKLWHGDLWECHGCGAQIISGVGLEPVTEHFKPGFKAVIEECRPVVQVNDC